MPTLACDVLERAPTRDVAPEVGVSSPRRDLRFDMSQVREFLGLPEPGHRDNWRLRAACRDLDGDDFYPGDGADVEGARRVCQGCAVRRSCLDEAIDRREPYGLWGGLTARQRRKEAKKRGIVIPAEPDADLDEAVAA